MDGDDSRLHAVLSEDTSLMEDEGVEDYEEEVAQIVNITRFYIVHTELTVQNFNRVMKSIWKLQIDGLRASFAKIFQLQMKFMRFIMLNLIVRYSLDNLARRLVCALT